MRYVFLAFAGLALGAIWLNSSVQGHKLKHQMMDHPAEPGQLY